MDRIPPYLIATRVNRRSASGPPRSGAALHAWAKDQEQLHEVALVRFLSALGVTLGLPSRMVDWPPESVFFAHSEARRKLRSLGLCPDHEAYEEALSN